MRIKPGPRNRPDFTRAIGPTAVYVPRFGPSGLLDHANSAPDASGERIPARFRAGCHWRLVPQYIVSLRVYVLLTIDFLAPREGFCCGQRPRYEFVVINPQTGPIVCRNLGVAIIPTQCKPT